jgi:hypothetical protein
VEASERERLLERAMRPAPPVRTPFGFESTAAEVVQGIDLRGKRAVVTGGASGIGSETARALASWQVAHLAPAGNLRRVTPDRAARNDLRG